MMMYSKISKKWWRSFDHASKNYNNDVAVGCWIIVRAIASKPKFAVIVQILKKPWLITWKSLRG